MLFPQILEVNHFLWAEQSEVREQESNLQIVITRPQLVIKHFTDNIIFIKCVMCDVTSDDVIM